MDHYAHYPQLIQSVYEAICNHRVARTASEVAVVIGYELRTIIGRLEAADGSLCHLPPVLIGQILLLASIVEQRDFGHQALADAGYPAFRDLRNRVAHDPARVTLGMLRRALGSVETPSFQTIYGEADSAALRALKIILHAHKGNINQSFESARDNAWKVAIKIDDEGDTSDSVEPLYVYELLKHILNGSLRGLDVQLAQNIFASEPQIPEQRQAIRGLLGVWATTEPDTEIANVAEEPEEPKEDVPEEPEEENVEEGRPSKAARKKAQKRARKQAAKEKETMENQVLDEARRTNEQAK